MTSSNRYSYTKRPGTGGQHGQQYEVKMSCVMFLRAVGSCNKFHLAANMKGAGAFDDLVLQLHSSDGSSRTFFMQLKHKLNADTVVPRSKLLSLTPKNDFSLLKYFLSFRDEICPQFNTDGSHQVYGSNMDDVSLILYTNARSQNEPDASDEQDDFLSTSPNGLIFSFRKNTDEDVITFAQHIELYRTFLEQLLDKLHDDGNSTKTIIEEVIEFVEHYKEQYSIQERKDNILEIANKLKNNPNSQQIVDNLRMISLLGDLSDYLIFVQKLKVCTSQAKESDLDCVILEELSKLFGMCREQCTLLSPKLLAKVQQWWAAEEGTYLTEESPLWSETIHDALLLMNERIAREVSSLGVRFNEDEIGLLRRRVVGDRVLLCLVEPQCTKIGFVKVIQTLQQMNMRFVLGSDHGTLRFWMTRWCNLLVMTLTRDNDEILSRINEILVQQPDKNIIIVTPESELRVIRGGLIKHEYAEVILNINFSGMDEVTKSKLLAKDVIFQGHCVPLGELIHGEQEIMEELEPELLMNILKDAPVSIGNLLEKLVPHYIPRTLQRRDVLRPDWVLVVTQAGGLVFAVGVCAEELQQLLPPGEQVLQFEGCVVSACRFYVVDDMHLSAIREQPGAYVCVGKEGDNFYAQTWGGNINVDLFVDHSRVRSLCPDTVHDLPGRVAIIAAEPGMGKSTLATCMALGTKAKTPTTWVVRVNLSGMTSYLESVVLTELTKERAINFVAEAAGVSGTFQRHLFQCTMRNNGCVVFFDGFDEICPDYKDQMMMMFRHLIQTGIQRMCITSRSHWKKILEQSLVLISFTVEEFSSRDQRRFLENIWMERVRDVENNNLQNFISDVLHLFTDSLNDVDRSFLGIPLQTMIVAEVFEQYLKEGLGPRNMDVVQLYEELFKKKCRVYFEQKRGDNVSHPAVKRKINIEVKCIEEMHICSAMVLYLSSKDVSSLHDQSFRIKGVNYLNEENSDWLAIGIIQSHPQGNPEFIHRTVMEFFVSKWIISNYRPNITFLQRKLLSDEYFVVRRMFNIMLTEGCSLHLATLNCDLVYLNQNLNIRNVNATDKGGRTLLHVALAGSSGQTNFKEMVLMLLRYGADIDVPDGILQWSAIQYADNSGNWMALGMIMQERNVAPELDHIKPRMVPALKIACREGYVELVRYLVKQGVAVNDEQSYSETQVLHVAAQHGHLNVLETLLRAGAYVNDDDEKHNTALHIAAENGFVNILGPLLDAGADINAEGLLGVTPLHLAVKNGHTEVVKSLLARGAQTDVSDVFGNTPLDFANANHHHDISNCLEEDIACAEEDRLALESALRQGNLDTVRLLLRSWDTLPNAGEGMMTPLHIAAVQGHVHIAQFLIQNGSPVDTFTGWSGLSPLHMAVMKGNCDIVRLLIDNGSAIDLPFSSLLPLSLAAHFGHLDVARLLIERGSPVHDSHAQNTTPLHYAVIEGHLHIVKLLLENRSNVNALDNRRMIPLHYAASKGHLDITRLLTDFGGLTDTLDNLHRYPLHWAVINGHLKVVRYLIDKHSSIDAGDRYTRTPIYYASAKGHLDIAQLLIERGATVNNVDVDKKSPLHCAAEIGHSETVRLLIDAGSVVDGRDKYNSTPLHYASGANHLDVVELLIESGAIVNSRDVKDRSPLHCSATLGHMEIVRLLIDRGSEVDARDKDDITALCCASRTGNLDATRLLIRKGAAVNTTDVENRSPLHCAAIMGHTEIVRHLIHCGSVVDARDINKKTALYFASRNGNLDVARLLLEKGAAVNAADVENISPLHCAAGIGDVEMVRLLIDGGSEVDARDKDKITALCCASRNGHLDVARLLIEKGATVYDTDFERRSSAFFCYHGMQQ